MFKKVVYIIFSVLLGFLVYLFAVVWIVGDYQVKHITTATEEENYEFFLSFTTYYNPTPVYESEESAPYKLKVFEVAADATDTTPAEGGLMFIFFDIDDNVIKIEDAEEEDKSTIVFYENEKSAEINLNLRSFSSYGTIYPFLAYGHDMGFNYMFGEFKDGELVSKADVKKITKIEFKDSEENVFCTIDQVFDLTQITYESIKAYDTPGMSAEEMADFNNPKSLIWQETLVVVVYILIAGGIGFIFFRKPKETKYHAETSSITYSGDNPYDAVTKQAAEERVTLKSDEEEK